MRRAELRRAAVRRRWAHGTTTSIKSREWSNGELRPVQGPGSAHEAACEREALGTVQGPRHLRLRDEISRRVWRRGADFQECRTPRRISDPDARAGGAVAGTTPPTHREGGPPR